MEIFIVILETVLAASISVMIICLTGAYLFKNGLINHQFTNKLSGLVERVFLPCLIVSNTIQGITTNNILEIVPIMMTSSLVIIIGYIIGLLSNSIWIKDERFKYIILLSCSNPHTTNLQLQVCAGLQLLLNDISIHLEYNSTIDAHTRAVLAITCLTALANTYRWTFGKEILLKFSRLEDIGQYRQRQIELFNIGEQHTELMASESSPMQDSKPAPQADHKFSMPLMSVLGSFVIVLIPPLQDILIRPGFWKNALFVPVQTLGRATTPLVLILLGSTIYSIIAQQNMQTGMSQKTLIQLTITKLMFIPFVGLILILIIYKLNFIVDPASLFVMFFTFATPSAINIIVQAKQYTKCEDVVSMILVYSYIASIITLPIWSVIFFSIMFQMK